LFASRPLLLARFLEGDLELAGPSLGLAPPRLDLLQARIVDRRSGDRGRRWRRRDHLTAASLGALELGAKMRRLGNGAGRILAGVLLGSVGFVEKPARMRQVFLELRLAGAALLLRRLLRPLPRGREPSVLDRGRRRTRKIRRCGGLPRSSGQDPSTPRIPSSPPRSGAPCQRGNGTGARRTSRRRRRDRGIPRRARRPARWET